jgi:hypothetical protein
MTTSCISFLAEVAKTPPDVASTSKEIRNMRDVVITSILPLLPDVSFLAWERDDRAMKTNRESLVGSPLKGQNRRWR